MLIVVNTRLLLSNKLEGIGWFAYETLKRIATNNPGHQFVFLFDRPFSTEFVFSENVTPVVVSPPTRHPLLWYLWFEWRIPAILKKYNADLFFSPDGYLSLRTNVPQLAVIHDINFVHRPKDLPWLTSKYYNSYFPKFAKKSVRLATVSNYSKNDISTNFEIPLSKIDVVYNGYKAGFAPLTTDEVAAVRKKFSNGKPYFLFVGALHPRKNIEGLLKAFDQFKKESGGEEKLLIAGGQMFKTGTIFKTWENMSFHDEVIFTGRVSNADLKQIFGGALALTFVPFFEGFGVPVIEAMASGIPAICSNTTSVPEVGGDAALYINPHSVDEISTAMKQISNNENLRNILIEKGYQQIQKFNWDKSAEKLWEIMQKCVKK